jgi:hypothetical protein
MLRALGLAALRFAVQSHHTLAVVTPSQHMLINDVCFVACGLQVYSGGKPDDITVLVAVVS